MMLACEMCSFHVSVEPGERKPPWCPRCGADLKETSPLKVATAATTSLHSAGDAAAVRLPANAAAIAGVAEHPLEDSSPGEGPALQTGSPRNPNFLADYVEIGAEGEVFRSNLVWQAAAWVCGVVCLGIVLAAASQLPRAPRGQLNAIYGCLGLFGAGVLVASYVCFRLAGQKYAVFPDRLVEWQHFASQSYRWDQIREVYEKVHPGWTTYEVLTRVGRRLTISWEIGNHKRLGGIISQRVAERLLPAVFVELEAGREFRLGPLRISQAGVVVDGEFEPWHRIGVPTFGLNPRVNKGTNMVSNMIHVRIGGSLVELGEIPNYAIFHALALHFSLYG